MTAAAILPWLGRLVLPLVLLAALYGVDQRAEQRGRLAAQAQQQADTMGQLARTIRESGQLAGVLGQFISQHQQEQANAQDAIDRLGADLRSGTIRLYVRTTPAAQSEPVPHGATSGPGQAHAELDPADAAALLGITADGDSAIRDLNACIDRYAAVQSAINGPTRPATP
jgi:prophage endopeptidase